MKIRNIFLSGHLHFLLLALLIFIAPGMISADEYVGALYYYYFARQPGARAEAMGRSGVAISGDAFSCLYNPALISGNSGLCLSASYASPYYILEDAKYSFIGLTYTSQGYGGFGLCRYNFDDGLSDYATDENGNIIGEAGSSESMYTLTYSYPVLSDFNIGINLSYYYHRLPTALFVGEENEANVTAKAFPIDLGLLKTFTFGSAENTSQRLTLGASLYNITNTDINYDDQADPLPQVFHLGIAYRLLINELSFLNLKQFQWLLQVEYQDVFNSRYYTGFKFGTEFSVYEILFIRLGYYTETHNDYGLSDVNKSVVDDFTYGFGLALPIKTIFNFPLIENIKFDMLSLEQPGYTNTTDDWGTYSLYNLTINFNL